MISQSLDMIKNRNILYSPNSVPELPPVNVEAPWAKIPDWSRSQMRHRLCPVCKEDSNIRICYRPDGLLVVSCRNCGMVYVPDIPIEKEISKFYSQYGDFKYHLKMKKRTYFQRIKDRIFLNYYARSNFHVQILLAYGGLLDKRLVEIGASFGNFTMIAKNLGAEVEAVEIDKISKKRLQSEFNVCVYDSIDDIQGPIDVVCAFQVLEHLADPFVMLKTIRRKMNEDGCLLLSVPNGGNADRIGANWIGFRVDLEHLNYFSPLSMCTLLSSTGFWGEQIWERNQPGTFRDSFLFDNPFKKMFTLFKTLILPTPLFQNVKEHGSYVLTILARAGTVVSFKTG